MSREWETWWINEAPDNFPRNLENVDATPIRKLIAREARRVGGSVLEVGCASCVDYPLYKRLGLRYMGVDISHRFLEHARQLYPDVDVREASILDLPFVDDCFDVSYVKSVICHLHPDEWREALKELWRTASRRMMVAWYVNPWSKKSVYGTTDVGCWLNRLNRDEVCRHLRGLRDFGMLTIQNVGGRDLYVVDKNW